MNRISTKKCRICLLAKADMKSVYDKVALGGTEKCLPQIIQAISGVQIKASADPKAIICDDCTAAILQAEITIRKCKESDERLKLERDVDKDAGGLTNANFLENSAQEETEVVTENANENGKFQAFSLKPKKHENLSRKRKQERSSNEKLEKTKIIKKENNNNCSSVVSPSRSAKEFTAPDESELHTKITPVDDALDTNTTHYCSASTTYTEKSIRLSTSVSSSSSSSAARRQYVRTVNKNKEYFFRCEHCSYTSHFATHFRAHLLHTHNIAHPRIFKCIQCPKDFLEYRYLQQHIAHDHQQQPKCRKFLCAECGRAFFKSSNLQYHKRTHLSKDVRETTPSVRCEICGKAYSQQSIRMHVLTVHAANRPHACTRCQACFALPKSLQAHIRTCHPTEIHRCPCCGGKFRVKSVYEAHVQRGGCQKLGYSCDHCALCFKTQERLEKHRMKVHKKLLHQQAMTISGKEEATTCDKETEFT